MFGNANGSTRRLRVGGSIHTLPYSRIIFLILQTIYVAALLGFGIQVLNSAGIPRTFLILTMLFFALNPVIVTHAVTMWKDAPFSATVWLLVCLLVVIARERQLTNARLLLLGVALLLICLLRSNGALIAVFVFVLLIIGFRLNRSKVIILGVMITLVLTVFNGPIIASLSIQKGHFAEAVGIPIQQIAAVVSEEDFRNIDSETLSAILPLEKWGSNYNPSSSNAIKFDESFNDEYLESHKIEFLAEWLQLVSRNPKASFKAWLYETEGYWHPGYVGTIGTQYSLFRTPAKDLIGLGLNPRTVSVQLAKDYPFLFGMGSLIWFLLLAFTVSIAIGKKEGLVQSFLVFSPLIAIELSMLIAAPIASDYRYMLSILLCLPALICYIYSLGRTD